jgi:hypothetical protein
MSSILTDLSALLYTSINTGGWGIAGSQPMTKAVQCAHHVTWSPNANFEDLTPYLTYDPHIYSDFFECVAGCKLQTVHVEYDTQAERVLTPLPPFSHSFHMCVFLHCLEELLTPSPPFPLSHPFPPISPLSPHLFPHMHYTYIRLRGQMIECSAAELTAKGEWLNIYDFDTF